MQIHAFIAPAVLVGANCIAADALPVVHPAQTPTAAGMIDVRSLVPDFSVDMRYAGSANFVGVKVDGYEAPRCYLLRPAAEALRRVELKLRERRLRLKIFDCYRPVRAVTHFMRWVADSKDQRTKPDYYPSLDKSALLGEYIAPTSGHSRGATLDLTLMKCRDDAGNCSELDMGTAFDFFDPRAHTDSRQVTAAQRDNRQRLRSAMQGEGFENYAQEWWHYTLQPEPSAGTAFDFPITADQPRQ